MGCTSLADKDLWGVGSKFLWWNGGHRCLKAGYTMRERTPFSLSVIDRIKYVGWIAWQDGHRHYFVMQFRVILRVSQTKCLLCTTYGRECAVLESIHIVHRLLPLPYHICDFLGKRWTLGGFNRLVWEDWVLHLHTILLWGADLSNVQRFKLGLSLNFEIFVALSWNLFYLWSLFSCCYLDYSALSRLVRGGILHIAREINVDGNLILVDLRLGLTFRSCLTRVYLTLNCTQIARNACSTLQSFFILLRSLWILSITPRRCGCRLSLRCVWFLRFCNLVAVVIFLHLNTNDALEKRLGASCGGTVDSFVARLSTRLFIDRVCFPIWLVDIYGISRIRMISARRRIEFYDLAFLSRRVYAVDHLLWFRVCRPLGVKIILAFTVFNLAISAWCSKYLTSCLFVQVSIWNLVCFDFLRLLRLVNYL